jgi:hypothetical protein
LQWLGFNPWSRKEDPTSHKAQQKINKQINKNWHNH